MSLEDRYLMTNRLKAWRFTGMLVCGDADGSLWMYNVSSLAKEGSRTSKTGYSESQVSPLSPANYYI